MAPSHGHGEEAADKRPSEKFIWNIFFSMGTFEVLEHLISVEVIRFAKYEPKTKENTMKLILQALQAINPVLTSAATRILLGFMLVTGNATFIHAQGQIASGTIGGSGSNPYVYSLTFSDAAGAASPIGSVWYAWVPGFFYLPGTPTSALAPAGWTANISGDSIQFVANSSANYIAAGQSLSGFGYQATFSPTQLAAAPNSGRSDAYSAGLFSDTGNIFVIQSIPEPFGPTLFFSGAASFWILRRRTFQTV